MMSYLIYFIYALLIIVSSMDYKMKPALVKKYPHSVSNRHLLQETCNYNDPINICVVTTSGSYIYSCNGHTLSISTFQGSSDCGDTCTGGCSATMGDIEENSICCISPSLSPTRGPTPSPTDK